MAHYKLSIQVRTVDNSPMHKHLLQYICAGLDIECKFTNETYRKPMIITQGTEERVRKCAKMLRRLARGKPRFKVIAWRIEKKDKSNKRRTWELVDSWEQDDGQ